MTNFHSWDDVKHEVFDAEDLEVIAQGAQRMVAEARAHRLVEMRKELGLTQSDIAERMHVRQERVSAIERGRTTSAEVGTIAAYVAALGGGWRSWPTSTARGLSSCDGLKRARGKPVVSAAARPLTS